MWSSIFTLIIVLSLQNAVARLWVDSQSEYNKASLINGVMLVVVISGVVVTSVVWLFAPHIADWFLDESVPEYIILGTFIAWFGALTHVPAMVVRMERKIVSYTVINILQTIGFATLAVVSVVALEGGISSVFWSQLVAYILAFGFALFAIRSYLKKGFSIELIGESLRYSLPLFPSVAVSKVNSYLDRIVLLAYFGLNILGVFGAAARLSMIANLFVQVFQQAWNPLALRVIQDVENRNEFYRRGFNYFLFVLTGASLLVSAFASEILAFLVPSEYRSGYVVIPWLMGAAILHGSSQFTNLGLTVSKKTFGNSKAAIIGAVVNVALALILIPTFGIWGAALGSFLSSLVFTSMLYYLSQIQVQIDLGIKRASLVLVVYVLSALVFVWFQENMANSSLFYRAMLFLGVTFLVGWLTLREELKSLRALLGKRNK